MRRLQYRADFGTNVLDGYRSWCIQEVECSGKTKITMMIRRMFLLVGRREGVAVRLVQTQLG